MIGIVTLNPCIDKSVRSSTLGGTGFINVKDTHYITGGKGLNVSRALRSFYTQHRGITAVGGHNGQRIVEMLETEGAPCSYIHVTPETRTITTVFDDNGDWVAYKETPAPWTDEDVAIVERKLNIFMEGLDILCISGSVPPGCPKDIYAKMIGKAKEMGITTVLDASGPEFVQGLAACPDYAVPNDEEVAAFLGYTVTSWDDKVQAVEALLRAGIPNPILTMGKEGSLFGRSTENTCCEVVFVHGPTVDTVNPTGCGDSFLAGLLYGLDQGLDMQSAMAFAAASGASDARSADAGVISVPEILKYIEDVQYDIQN